MNNWYTVFCAGALSPNTTSTNNARFKTSRVILFDQSFVRDVLSGIYEFTNNCTSSMVDSFGVKTEKHLLLLLMRSFWKIIMFHVCIICFFFFCFFSLFLVLRLQSLCFCCLGFVSGIFHGKGSIKHNFAMNEVAATIYSLYNVKMSAEFWKKKLLFVLKNWIFSTNIAFVWTICLSIVSIC